jgi:hypothetical protein
MTIAELSGRNVENILFIIFVFGGWIIPIVIYTLATTWRKVRESAQLAALKQSMVEKGLSVEEIERVLRASAKPQEEEDPPVVKLAECLASQKIPPGETQEILSLLRAAHPATQPTAAKSLITMLEEEAEAEQVVAAARALCGSVPPPEAASKDYRFTDEASALRQ